MCCRCAVLMFEEHKPVAWTARKTQQPPVVIADYLYCYFIIYQAALLNLLTRLRNSVFSAAYANWKRQQQEKKKKKKANRFWCFILHNERIHLLCSRWINNELSSNIQLLSSFAVVTQALKGFHGVKICCVHSLYTADDVSASPRSFLYDFTIFQVFGQAELFWSGRKSITHLEFSKEGSVNCVKGLSK